MDAPAAPETIGQRLRRLRHERRLSQRELSSPGVSYAYISRIEAGTRQPSVKALRKLAAKLGVSADYLETGLDVRDVELRELRLSNAELAVRLEGETSKVEDELRDVLGEALGAGDQAGAMRARIALAHAAAAAGRQSDAVELLEEVVGSDQVTPSSRPDVYATLGRMYAATGALERAVTLYESALDALQADDPENVAAHVRFAAYLSFALTDTGEIARAQRVLEEVLPRAEELADPYARVRLYWSLARVAAHDNAPSVALDYYRRAIALLEATDDTLHLARAHLACAATLIADDKPEEAGPFLEAAESLFGKRPLPEDEASLRTEQARAAVLRGSLGEAVERAEQALRLLGDSDPGEQGAALLALGEARLAAGEAAAAEDAFRRSAAAFEAGGRVPDAAHAYRELGRLLRDSGRESEALDVLDRAAQAAAGPRAGLRA
jgi:transcriptional regulator with XRE-family HTH domain